MLLKYALKIFLFLTLVQNHSNINLVQFILLTNGPNGLKWGQYALIPKEARYKHNYKYNIQNQNPI